jgi:DNA-binding transcriptional ArsR family regulator
MGWLQDLLQEVPLSGVLRERVALAEQKYGVAIKENDALKQRVHALENENTALKGQIPNKQNSGLAEDTARALAYLFRAEGDECDVGVMARALEMDKGVIKYHLDLLDEAGFATCTGFNSISGHVYWALTSDGRRHAVERKLI